MTGTLSSVLELRRVSKVYGAGRVADQTMQPPGPESLLASGSGQ